MKKPQRKRELDKPKTARTLTPAELERARGGHAQGEAGFLVWQDDWLAPV
jgi:hypothetical protein